MSDGPRLLTIMGSGETAPTMVKVHREVVKRCGGPVVALDTPYGFQENADELSAKTIEYFRVSLDTPLTFASLRSVDDIDTPRYETALAALAEARVIFAGPGSPSYALRTWAGSAVPDRLRARLRDGGAVVFASAAAVTLGRWSVPVYEIYKVGESVRWLDGLDIFYAATGVAAAVIPHFDNAEGATHDTRFCYLGERRLSLLVAELPADAIVFGVDEHTAAILDADDRTVEVIGRGVVTVRWPSGATRHWPSGTTFSFDALANPDEGQPIPTLVAFPPAGDGNATKVAGEGALGDEVAAAEQSFAAAVTARDGPAAAAATLDLEATIRAWATDPSQTDDVDRARAALRTMITRLGSAAASGLADPALAVAPFVDALLALRAGARDDGRFADADAARHALVAAGIEVNDGPQGTTWRLVP